MLTSCAVYCIPRIMLQMFLKLSVANTWTAQIIVTLLQEGMSCPRKTFPLFVNILKCKQWKLFLGHPVGTIKRILFPLLSKVL